MSSGKASETDSGSLAVSRPQRANAGVSRRHDDMVSSQAERRGPQLSANAAALEADPNFEDDLIAREPSVEFFPPTLTG
ncbi:hypothetical protein FRC07_008622, partial [Ceratobasidium sp. 392]